MNYTLGLIYAQLISKTIDCFYPCYFPQNAVPVHWNGVYNIQFDNNYEFAGKRDTGLPERRPTLRHLHKLAGALDAAPVSGIEFRIDVIPFVVNAERQICNLVALREEHLFVEGLHLEQFRTFFA